ncbi:hypothetical protein [Pseudomonas retamae]|uniref:Uncharacterized protein n=1 Tax=Pseudomonas retamae TaxID=702110 RepID=A0ABW7DD30_9PSED
MSTGLGCNAFVCAGTLVLVASELPDAQKTDVLNALLYAQTVADRNVADLSATSLWTQARNRAMSVTGALLLGEPEIHFPVPMPSSFNVLELAQQAMHRANPDMAVIADDWLQGLQLEQTPAALEVLEKHVVKQDKWVRFLLTLVSAQASITTVVICFQAVGLMDASAIERRFSGGAIAGNMSVSASKALLEPEDYDFSRAAVLSLLGERCLEQIIGLT